ncbi:MAG TPA: aspartate-semialdehyde dehydrogenase [Longimicrobiales bacterium]|nr:aspartate-semialdehyde dehydrogenase [Longimicrobiales bacterium]
MSGPQPTPVAVLGATGLVGERILLRLARHPWFRVAEVAASQRSAGALLRERISPDVAAALPGAVSEFILKGPGDALSSPLVLSALPSGAAREVEPRLAAAGHLVVSNASAFRAHPGIPLIIPEINAGHLELLTPRAGGIVTNPNCAVAPLALALAPLHRAFRVERVVATTFQAVSGAGKDGPTVLDLLDNLFPVIAGEEEKVEREAQKLLGSVEGGEVVPADFPVSATTTRVPVLHGHMVDLSVAFSRPVSVDEARAVMELFNPGPELPSLPSPPLHVTDDPLRPQPRLDRDRGGGMTVTVGRIRPCRVNHLRFLALAHNLERGAAGAAVSNAELCAHREWIPG